MQAVNPFVGKPGKPTPAELAAALGSAKTAWDRLIADLANDEGVTIQEWKASPVKHGWSLRLKRGERVVVYLSPSRACFMVGIVLGKRAVQAAHGVKLPAKVVQAIDQAPRYPEGTGVRLVVSREREVPAVKKLARIKLEN